MADPGKPVTVVATTPEQQLRGAMYTRLIAIGIAITTIAQGLSMCEKQVRVLFPRHADQIMAVVIIITMIGGAGGVGGAFMLSKQREHNASNTHEVDKSPGLEDKINER